MYPKLDSEAQGSFRTPDGIGFGVDCGIQSYQTFAVLTRLKRCSDNIICLSSRLAHRARNDSG